MFQLLFIAIVGGLVYWFTRRRRHGWTAATPSQPGEVPTLPPAMADSLRSWAEAGLISAGERDAIEAFELAQRQARAAAQPHRRIPAIAEALAYLGGILAAAGVVQLLAQAWSDMNTFGHLVTTIVSTAALVGVGLAARDQEVPELVRLRAFVWLASTVTAGAFGAVLAVDVFGTDFGPTVTAFAAGAVLAHSIALWRGGDVPLEQLTAAAALAVLVGAVVAQWSAEGGVGVAVWAVGVVLVVVALERWGSHPVLTGLAGAGAGVVGVMIAAPYYAQDAGILTGATIWAMGAVIILLGVAVVPEVSVVALLLGSVATVIGVAIMAAQSAGTAPVVGLANAVVLLVLGTRPRLALISVAGCLGLLINVPWTVAHFFPGEGRAPLLVSLSGLVILGVAWLLVRQRGRLQAALHTPSSPESHDAGRRHFRSHDGPPAVTAP